MKPNHLAACPALTKSEDLPYHPTVLGGEYALPPALAAGKTTVNAKSQAAPDAPTAAVLDVRIVPAS